MAYDTSESSEMDILNPSALVLPRCANVATEINNEQGYFAYCNTNNKLGFVTSSGVSAEVVTSA